MANKGMSIPGPSLSKVIVDNLRHGVGLLAMIAQPGALSRSVILGYEGRAVRLHFADDAVDTVADGRAIQAACAALATGNGTEIGDTALSDLPASDVVVEERDGVRYTSVCGGPEVAWADLRQPNRVVMSEGYSLSQRHAAGVEMAARLHRVQEADAKLAAAVKAYRERAKGEPATAEMWSEVAPVEKAIKRTDGCTKTAQADSEVADTSVNGNAARVLAAVLGVLPSDIHLTQCTVRQDTAQVLATLEHKGRMALMPLPLYGTRLVETLRDGSLLAGQGHYLEGVQSTCRWLRATVQAQEGAQ